MVYWGGVVGRFPRIIVVDRLISWLGGRWLMVHRLMVVDRLISWLGGRWLIWLMVHRLMWW